MELTTLTAISPIDGRYNEKVSRLRSIFSEFGLMRFRVLVEIRWLQTLAANPDIAELSSFSDKSNAFLNQLAEQFNQRDAEHIKEIESTTNHDVKAVEYFLSDKMSSKSELLKAREFIHFACTSEDINNVAYALMLKQGRDEILIPTIDKLIQLIEKHAHLYAADPMLSRTHGQAATPTTMGKEFAVFVYRLKEQRQRISNITINAKFNGAVGNFNAHVVAYPELDWLQISREFIEKIGLNYNPYTTQIESHDYIAELCDAITRVNQILINFSRDIWSYIAIHYFDQKVVESEVGSSTMPHKINPIDFENAEGNLALANTLCQFFSRQLTTSRWQRDLVDSTLLRNLGLVFAHSLIAYKSLIKGITQLAFNKDATQLDLDQNWEVLAEAIQTVMRRYGIEKSYEKLKSLTRGKEIDQNMMHQFIDSLDLPEAAIAQLKALTPASYIGIAKELAEKV